MFYKGYYIEKRQPRFLTHELYCIKEHAMHCGYMWATRTLEEAKQFIDDITK